MVHWCASFENLRKNICTSWVKRLEKGTPHLQGYVEKRTGRFRPIPKFQVVRNNDVNAIHFERARGSRTENWTYCSKDNKYITNIKRPTMSYYKSKQIWAETKGIANETYTRADIEEAAIHIQFADDLPCMNDKAAEQFIKDYKEMMARRYPNVTDEGVPIEQCRS